MSLLAFCEDDSWFFGKAKVEPLRNTMKKVRAENEFSKLLEEAMSNNVA